VLSYLLAKGHCRYCGAKIPPQSVILESLTFVMMAGLAVAFRFRFIGVILGFVGYEALKVGFLVKYGKREKKFGEEIAVSLGYNAGFFGLFALMSALTHT
jgi:prepilin signal peptidase PulO-like enzyme (type II secretory pathway)